MYDVNNSDLKDTDLASLIGSIICQYYKIMQTACHQHDFVHIEVNKTYFFSFKEVNLI